MNHILRAAFAPAIISAYITYGVVTTEKTIGQRFGRKPYIRDYLAGGVLGLAFGGYYVITGQRLDEGVV